MSNNESVSALMPVHAGVEAEHLNAAIASLLAQTRQPDEIVLVEDGPLRPEHLRSLRECENRHPNVVRVRLVVNQGAGVANQAGLRAASGMWVVKVDSDDISLPHRIERQLEVVRAGDVDVCGAAMLEFEGSEENIVGLRVMPESQRAIGRRLRSNNPISHPTVLYRRQLALEVGGYGDLRYMQDYDLMARLYVGGARMFNLSEALVLFRSGDQMRARRRWSQPLAIAEKKLQENLARYGVIGPRRAFLNRVFRNTLRRLPEPVVKALLRHLLSQPVALDSLAGQRSR